MKGQTYTLGIAAGRLPVTRRCPGRGVRVHPGRSRTAPQTGSSTSSTTSTGRSSVCIDRDSSRPVARLVTSAHQRTAAADRRPGRLLAPPRPNGVPLTYEWDLDGDGDYDDATGATAAGDVHRRCQRPQVGVKVSDPSMNFSTASETIYPGNTAPGVTIDVLTQEPWSANDDITFTITRQPTGGRHPPHRGRCRGRRRSTTATPPRTATCTPTRVRPAPKGSTITGPSHGYPSFLTPGGHCDGLTRPDHDGHPSAQPGVGHRCR